jgi:hypothetical protein
MPCRYGALARGRPATRRTGWGACLGLQPEKVCIHAGVKQGEAALGLDPERGSVEMSNRWNDCHYPTGFKWAARGRKERKA